MYKRGNPAWVYMNGVFYRNWRREEENGQVDSFDFLTRNERERED